jgi:DNA-directed RNA polymerase specialized sigma24 family protein
MTYRSLTMRKLKEILRLKYDAKLSHRQIAKSLTLSASTVSDYCHRADSRLGACGVCQQR